MNSSYVNNSNKQSQSKGDTFQSCNENDANNTYFDESEINYSFKSFTKNESNFSMNVHSNSSIKDLDILFEGHGYFFIYDVKANEWILIGDSDIQVIADDGMSQKGIFLHFDSFMITFLQI